MMRKIISLLVTLMTVATMIVGFAVPVMADTVKVSVIVDGVPEDIGFIDRTEEGFTEIFNNNNIELINVSAVYEDGSEEKIPSVYEDGVLTVSFTGTNGLYASRYKLNFTNVVYGANRDAETYKPNYIVNSYGRWIKTNSEGKIDFDYTGLWYNENGWWYVENGSVDFFKGTVEAPELVQNNNGWWAVVDGKVRFDLGTADAPALVQNRYGWWAVVDGKVRFDLGTADAPALVQNKYGWWAVVGGKVDFSYNGVAANKNGTWRVSGGKVDFDYTGLMTETKNAHDYIKWLIRGGKVIEEFDSSLMVGLEEGDCITASELDLLGTYISAESLDSNVAYVDSERKLVAIHPGSTYIVLKDGSITSILDIQVYSYEDYFDGTCKFMADMIMSQKDDVRSRLLAVSSLITTGFTYDNVYGNNLHDVIKYGKGTCYSAGFAVAGICKAMGYEAEVRSAIYDDMSRYPSGVIFASDHYNVKVTADGETYYIDSTPGSFMVYLSTETECLYGALYYGGTWISMS